MPTIINYMVYLFVDKSELKLLYVKKTLLKQYEVGVFNKIYETAILKDGEVQNVDLLASAIKEAYTSVSKGLVQSEIKDKDIVLILPQESFSFFRFKVPSDVASTAINSYVKDKARVELPKPLNNYFYNYVERESNKQKQISFFAIEKESFQRYEEVLSLLNLRVQSVLLEAQAYFTLFDKTLRKGKKENILFVHYLKNKDENIPDKVKGYLYDSFGLLENKKWEAKIEKDSSLEKTLSDKRLQLENSDLKLNRIILSGKESDLFRQDMFTKKVGVWTNPLKRIINNFYDDYRKLLVIKEKSFSILQYDVCFGAFILDTEKDESSFIKIKSQRRKLAQISLPKKEILIFIVSFILSLATFFLISKFYYQFKGGVGKIKMNFGLFSKKKIVPTQGLVPKKKKIPTKSPTPTEKINRELIKIKILNGSGIKGKAGKVSDILKELGYQEIVTGNADNFDYLTTEIQIKKSKENIASYLKKDLQDHITKTKVLPLDKEESADVVLIIGQDFK